MMQQPLSTTAAATGDFNTLLADSNSLLSSISRQHQHRTSSAAHQGGGGSHTSSGEQLPSQSSFLQPRQQQQRLLGEKSLTELSVASRYTLNNTHTAASSAATTYEGEASAHRLLAREGYGFDSARLGRNVRELEMRASTTPAAASGLGDAIGAAGGGWRTMTSGGGEEKKEMDRHNEQVHPESATALDMATLATLQGSSLQQILNIHSEQAIKLAIRGAREWTDKLSNERIKNRLLDDWEQERDEIFCGGGGGSGVVLGHRFFLSNNISRGSSSCKSGGGKHYLLGSGMEGVASNVPLLEGGTSADGPSCKAHSSVYSNIIPSPQALPANLQLLIKIHLGCIDKYLKSHNNGNGGVATTTATTSLSSSSLSLSDAMTLLTSFEDGLKDFAANNDNKNLNLDSMNGYSDAMSLIKSILNCSVSLGIVPSSSSSPMTDVAVNVIGSCNFFAHQFQHHVASVVREAELSGLTNRSGLGSSNVDGEGLIPSARDLRTFTSIVVGSEIVNGKGGVWPQLYYSLRCGDALAAESIVNQHFIGGGGGMDSNGDESLSGVDQAVIDIISQLVTLQQQPDQETIFGDSTNGNSRPPQQLEKSLLSPTQAMLQSRRQVCELYERTKTLMMSPSSLTDNMEPFVAYRGACLALLGGAESISEASVLESSGIVKTVEDYLYASLWHALHLADTPSSIGGEGGLHNVARAVARLGKLVNEWGPSYFEQQDDLGDVSAASAVAAAAGVSSAHKEPASGGWAYTLPLLASQQYATALAYLAEAGGGLGLLEATHIGVIMDVAGLSASDFNMEIRNNASNVTSQALVPMLVASFSASLQGFDAEAALRYLMLLSGKGKFVKEQVQRLLLETRQFETLAGKVRSDGSRSNAALDAYFSRREVSSILAEGANVAVRSGKPADAAELLVLSGHFGALFTLMNRELAAYLVASTQEEFAKRQFWFNAASQFHAIHLAHGKMYVQNALDAEGRMSLGNTFQLLMNLVVFFDRCRENQWEGAWVLMHNLNLLPKADSEMTVKVEAFFQLDNCVKQIFHHVVLATMETLCHLFRSLRHDGAGVSIQQQNTIDQRLDELRTHARLLVTFSRLLNLPGLGDGDTYVRIAQLEKNMM